MTADKSNNGTEDEEQTFFSRRKVLGGTLAAAGAGALGYSQFMQSAAPAMAAEANFTANDLIVDTAGGDVSNLAFDGDTTEITVDYENFHQDLEGEEGEFPVDLALEFDPSSDSFSQPNDSSPSDIQAVHDGMDGSGTETDPYVITNDHELQAIEMDTHAHYVLGQNIDASGTVNWTWSDGDGFEPIAIGESEAFSGTLDGKGNVIDGLYIDSDRYNIGLFGFINGGEVRDIGFTNCEITGDASSAGLVAGYDAYSNVTVLDSVYATGSVTAGSEAGALLGDMTGSFEMQDCYADVTVEHFDLNSGRSAGGLVGRASSTDENFDIVDCYAVGSVTGYERVGGLIGFVGGPGTVQNSFAAGPVSGDIDVGGFIGLNTDSTELSLPDTYWDTEASGQTTAVGNVDDSNFAIVGLTTSEMQGEAAADNMNFDYDGAWNLVIDPDDYPELSWEDPVQVLAGGALDVAATPHDTVTELLGSAALAGGNVDFADHPWVSDDYAEFEPGVDEDQKVTTVTVHVDAASETYDDLAASDSVDATITVTDADARIDVGGHIELAGEAENEPA